jgi:hypothetical protein
MKEEDLFIMREELNFFKEEFPRLKGIITRYATKIRNLEKENAELRARLVSGGKKEQKVD